MGYKTELTSNNTDLQSILSAVNALPDALDTSDATATAADIAKDKTAYVNGVKVVGTNNGVTPIGTEISIKSALGANITKGTFLGVSKTLEGATSSTSSRRFRYHIARNLNMLLVFSIYTSTSTNGDITVYAYDLSTLELLWEESDWEVGREIAICQSRNMLCCAGGTNSGSQAVYYTIYELSRTGMTKKYSGSDSSSGDGQSIDVAVSEDYFLFKGIDMSKYITSVNLSTGAKKTTTLSANTWGGTLIYGGNGYFIWFKADSGNATAYLLKVNSSGTITQVATSSSLSNIGTAYCVPTWVPAFGTCYVFGATKGFKITYTTSSISIALHTVASVSTNVTHSIRGVNYVDFPEVASMICSVSGTNSRSKLLADGSVQSISVSSNKKTGICIDLLPVYYDTSDSTFKVDMTGTDRYIVGTDAIISLSDLADINTTGKAISSL